MKRHLVSLLIAMLFVTLAVTGIMGFFLPFNLRTVSVHALVGFLFIGAIALHLKNNFRQLRGYFSKPGVAVLALFVVALIAFILWQPAPVRAVLGLSGNLGPELDRFEMQDSRMIYQYVPDPRYKMQLEIVGGAAFDPGQPPFVAIWLENRSGYHIKSLHHSETEGHEAALPYWHFKRSEFLKYKRRHEQMTEAERQAEIDAMSSATENDSFDPADYILPDDPEREAPFRVMVEINALGDANDAGPDQPSLVFSVEVDNRDPRTFQVVELVGYPVREEQDGEVEWSLRYADDSITTARDLLDSALLRIERQPPPPDR